jgi:hypothetical protein
MVCHVKGRTQIVNRVLRRIFEIKRVEVTGGRRKLHNEELHNLYSSSNIVRMIRYTRVRCAGHAACMGYEKYVKNFSWKTSTGRDRS